MILHLVGFSCSTFTLRVWIPCLQILSCVAFLAWMCHLVEGDLKDSLPSGICSGCHPWFKCLETELKKKLQKKEEHFLDFLSAIPATSPYPFELDVCRIHLEEYHEPVFCTFNSFIRYTVIFSVHTWNTEDSEGESKKNLVTFSALSW